MWRLVTLRAAPAVIAERVRRGVATRAERPAVAAREEISTRNYPAAARAGRPAPTYSVSWTRCLRLRHLMQ